ncbi:MAG TPA: protocatechuate 3,4-dioxygenase subunit alpha [Pseudolysinimonas sp.]|nr:protocatechuate 3,4-dioxygenase subunit alpha [Pseudolysinimonas sp.]
MAPLAPTGGQTVGPFFAFGLPYAGGTELVSPYSPGAQLISGVIYDGAGDPIPDALIEIWQPRTDGSVPAEPGSINRDGATFTGFGRAATEPDGSFRFWTLAPGAEPGSNAAPFLSAVVFARGLLDRLHTRIYFPDDEAALQGDPLLSSLDPERRATLIARRVEEGRLMHDIHLQGESETVFLVFS